MRLQAILRLKGRCNRALLALAILLSLAAKPAPSQTYSALYLLGTNSGDAVNPAWMGLFAQGRDGNLYSTAQSGGAKGFGAVFQLTPTGTTKVLYSFKNKNDGAFPNSGLTLGLDGSLYGTTSVGGAAGFGTVFKMTTSGEFTVLHAFNGNTEGVPANAPPILGPDGNLYGTTSNGFNAVFGTVYKLTPKGKLTVIHTFDGSIRYPLALIQGTDGNVYGTTLGGGINNFGTVFRISPRGKFSVLYSFDGTHGQNPMGAIIQGADGNFYGTTRAGGSGGNGVAYQLTSAGAITVLRNFANDSNGLTPFAGLVQATDGKFYGVTTSNPGVSFGTIFQLTSSGTYTNLVFFTNESGNFLGASPQVSLFQHTNGALYGDTTGGGSPACIPGCGVLYSLNMGLDPFVSVVNWWGKIGDTVEILGQGLTGTSKVSFNGISASFTVVSDTYLTATVPAGATTGLVTVKTAGGTLKSNRKFILRPFIQSFDPPSGPVGTPVTITGTSFSGAKKVSFGGVKATTFSVDSDTQITASVPAGAASGKIQVSTPRGTAVSATDFTVTP